jgi:hypothetical protein
MNGTFVSDFQKSLALLISEHADQEYLSFDPIDKASFGFTADAIFDVNFSMLQSDANNLQRPSFSVSVHPNGHAGARAERGEEEFVRIRARITPAYFERFVRLQLMGSNRDVLQIPGGSGCYFYVSRHSQVLSNRKSVARPLGVSNA